MDEAVVREMVVRHDEAIDHVSKSIERLASAVEKTDDKMDKVIDALSQNAVILERISNIDSSNKDSVNRLHKRIDDIEKTIEHKEDAMSIRITSVAVDARKGGNLYDMAVYTVKALACALPLVTGALVGILWLIDHSNKG
jgi:tetrahydromethanopterin S-methyltransferase subunit G